MEFNNIIPRHSEGMQQFNKQIRGAVKIDIARDLESSIEFLDMLALAQVLLLFSEVGKSTYPYRSEVHDVPKFSF